MDRHQAHHELRTRGLPTERDPFHSLRARGRAMLQHPQNWASECRMRYIAASITISPTFVYEYIRDILGCRVVRHGAGRIVRLYACFVVVEAPVPGAGLVGRDERPPWYPDPSVTRAWFREGIEQVLSEWADDGRAPQQLEDDTDDDDTEDEDMPSLVPVEGNGIDFRRLWASIDEPRRPRPDRRNPPLAARPPLLPTLRLRPSSRRREGAQ